MRAHTLLQLWWNRGLHCHSEYVLNRAAPLLLLCLSKAYTSVFAGTHICYEDLEVAKLCRIVRMAKIEFVGGNIIDADVDLLNTEECIYFQELDDTGERPQ